MEALAQWFQERPVWLREATARLLNNGALTATDIDDVVKICKKEVGLPVDGLDLLQTPTITLGQCAPQTAIGALRLSEISDIKGINALAPRNPLAFHPTGMTVIFGPNGSGKSGYARALRYAAGSRKCTEPLGDVFGTAAAQRGCQFIYTIDGQEQTLDWKVTDGCIEPMNHLAIFDTHCANIYVNEENALTYEPQPLPLFTELSKICDTVAARLQEEADNLKSALPQLPAAHAQTASATWYGSLSARTTQVDIDANCQWDAGGEQTLAELTGRLSGPDPSTQATRLREAKRHADTLTAQLRSLFDGLSAEKFDAIQTARKDAQDAWQVAQEDADKVFVQDAPVRGVGTKSWQSLWEAAREFSTSEAYQECAYPHIDGDTRCVLCQQPLTDVAKARLAHFEAYVRGKLQADAKAADKNVDNLLAALPKDIPPQQLDTVITAAQIPEDQRPVVRQTVERLRARRNAITADAVPDVFPELPENTVLATIEAHATQLDGQATALGEVAKMENRQTLLAQRKELTARKWLSEQQQSIQAEVVRLGKIQKYADTRRLTSTQAISLKKSDLVENMVTPLYITRFKTELETLGAKRIPVELAKTRTAKGETYFKLQLTGSAEAVQNVLSEGEFRIVSLAAFLADVIDRTSVAPFVFDDPVSSLDQDYEEAVVAHLVELCSTRQVIVFTHRISMLALIDTAARKASIKVQFIGISRECWGAGEPGDIPLRMQAPKAALNTILNNRLPAAKRILEQDGQEMYEPVAGGICKQIRICVERLVEDILIDQIVRRYYRELHTKDKLVNLTKIVRTDCDLLEGMMSKYSIDVHSQPDDTPLPLPNHDEMTVDVRRLLAWIDEFKRRPVPANEGALTPA